MATGQPSYASFYRETRVTETEFWAALDAARADWQAATIEAEEGELRAASRNHITRSP